MKDVPFFKILWDENDVTSITSALTAGKNWAVGEKIEQFEQLIAQYMGTKYAVVFNSGTSALHAILKTYDIGKDDEVIVPSFTFISTANAPLFTGAQPVFADIEEKTYGLDPTKLETYITPNTKAILPVHYGGCPCQIDKIKKIAEKHNLILIEDTAEAMGATINNKKVGTFGDSAILSFCQNKIITTGEGGAVITDSQEVYEKLLLIRSHGRLEIEGEYFDSGAIFDYINLGYNFRMSNLTAALGISQIEKITQIIHKRQIKAEYMTHSLLQKTSHVKPLKIPNNYKSVYQLYSCIAEDRDGLLAYLAEKNIGSKVYFHPVHQTHFYKEKLGYNISLPVTEKVADEIITLPMFPTITDEEIDYITDTIAEYYKGE